MKTILCSVLCFLVFTLSANKVNSVWPVKGGGGENESSNKAIATFDVTSMRISKEGLVSWTSINEHGSLPYYIEQFVFDKWVAVAKIDGIGTPVPNSYSVPVVLNSGENVFRIKQKGYDKISRFSNSINYYSKKTAVNYKVTKKNLVVEFSDNTYYVIYNPYGLIVKQGYGNSVDISNYAKGYYCLVYDNKLGGFEKKKVIFKNTFCPIVINTPEFVKRYQKKRAARNPYSRFKVE